MTIENALRHYMLEQKEIRNVFGNHIYAGRIPQGETPAIAALITRTATKRYYDLAEEAGIVTPSLNIEFVTKANNGAALAMRAAEQVRLKVSSYRGNWGPAHDQIMIHSCAVELDVMTEPVFFADGSRWTFTYSMLLRISHEQTSVPTP